MKWIRLLTVGIFVLAGLMTPRAIYATCWSGNQDGPDAGVVEICENYNFNGTWSAAGTAVYSCGTYDGLYGPFYGCYHHQYVCDTPCYGGGGGTPSCFLPGTVVADKSGGTKIEDLKAGDTVSSFANDKVLDASVSSVYKSQRDHYYQLWAGDYSVSVTAEHPFYVGNGRFSEVKDLVVGAVIYVKDGAEMVAKTLTEKRRVDEVTDVYNLSVDTTNTYFANDFAVHNKGGGFVCPMTPINCPAGTVRGPTIVGSQCQSYQCQNSIGTAQQVGNCCNWNNPPQVCGDWYDCPTPANPGKVCRDCEEEEPSCTQYSYDQYECLPTCSAVAPAVPTLTSPANGADLGNTTVNLLWNSVSDWGTACAGTRQYQVIIDTNPAPTTVYATVGEGVTSDVFVGAVGNTYYWKIRAQ